jgi:DNA-binding SARP family transcriptional activator
MLRLYFLGPVKIMLNNRLITGFESRKTLALFCYLALHTDPVLRAHLANLFWGDKPEKRGRGNLSRALNNLNALLPGAIAADRYSLQFKRGEGVWLDTDAFAALTAQRSPEDRTEAISLYRGDFLADLRLNNAPEFEIWLATEQERRRQRAADLLQLLTTHYADSRDYAAALKWARQLLALTPWQEEAHRQVMTLLARRGQFSAALAQYQNCRRALRAELSVEPSTETQTLQRRILNARSAPPLRFPQFPTPFVGRRDDLAQIARLLAKPACRLLTLLGLGGSGKTRLAIEAAKAQRHAFLDGVVFISLAAIDSGSAFYAALAEALRLPLHPAEDPQRQLIEFLQDREILLALDNFEHLLDGTALLTEILTAAPRTKLLITSRERLNLRGEWVYRVAGLRLEADSVQGADSAAAAGRAALPEAVDLFRQRARQAATRSATRSLWRDSFSSATLRLNAVMRVAISSLPRTSRR